MTIAEAKKYAVQKLPASPTPILDANVLLSFITGMQKSDLLAHRDAELSEIQKSLFLEAIDKRATGLPIAYITGTKEFFGLDFAVTMDVLIPKPDTEILVEKTLEIIEKIAIAKMNAPSPNPQNLQSTQINLCDVCTGSGCVGISAAHAWQEQIASNLISAALPPNSCNDLNIQLNLTLTDISEAALKIAKQNAQNLLLPEIFEQTKFAQGDLLSAVSNVSASCDTEQNTVTKTLFDVIVSNPPYIPSKMVDELLLDGRNEPRLALDGFDDGLAIIKRLVPQAYEHLSDGGFFLCEAGEYNACATADIFVQSGFVDVVIYDDLEGTPRVVCGMKK